MRAAVFDFDGTLCPGDSIVPYLRFCVREGPAPHSQWLRAASGYLRQLLRPSEVAAAKARSLSFIAGRTRAEMDALAERFFRECLRPRFFPEAVRAVEACRAEGLCTVVLSASASVYMDALPRFLPLDAVLCTRCELKDGRYTGQVGPNCRGEEKVRRLRAWAGDEPLEVVRAYGDSAHDIPVMRLAAEPVWVNPSGKAAGLFRAETVLWKGGAARADDQAPDPW